MQFNFQKNLIICDLFIYLKCLSFFGTPCIGYNVLIKNGHMRILQLMVVPVEIIWFSKELVNCENKTSHVSLPVISLVGQIIIIQKLFVEF